METVPYINPMLETMVMITEGIMTGSIVAPDTEDIELCE